MNSSSKRDEMIANTEAAFAETVSHISAKWRTLGYTTAELPVVLRPMLEELAEIRARQIAEIDALFAEQADAPPSVH